MDSMPNASEHRAALALWSASTRDELERALGELDAVPEARDLRPAETGLVMARGRIGGSGAAFNGER